MSTISLSNFQVREKGKIYDQHRHALMGCQEQPFEGVGSHPLSTFNSLLTLGPYVSHFR